MSSFQKDEDKYRGLFSNLAAEWISCNHTNKSIANIGYQRASDGKWIQLYTALFFFFNEKEQPLQWKFTKTKRFAEVSNAFQQLANRFKEQGLKQLRGIFTRTCCKWALKFKDIFPGVPIKLDLFHAVQRFTSSIPTRKQYHANITRDYSLVFRAPTDIGEKRLENTPNNHVLEENMEKFEKKWKHIKYDNGENVLNAKAIKEINNIKVHISKGCLSDIPPGCGTTRNERLNRHLNEFLQKSKMSVYLAYARCFKLFSKLKCMDDAAAYLYDVNTGNVRLESFAIDNANTLKNCEGDQKKQIHRSMKMLSESNVTEIARTIGINSMHSAAFTTGSSADRDFEINNSVFIPQDSDRLEQFETPLGSAGNVVQIPRDGNCFFMAVASHVLQLISDSSTESNMVRNHLESIGITRGKTISSLAQLLRRLVVEEWTGEFRSEYEGFLTNHAPIEKQAQAFLTDGHYSTSLGDAMPLAMANVLQIPLHIYFTPGDGSQRVSPRDNVEGIAPLPLAFTNDGPGHYDALIPAEDRDSNDGSKSIEKPVDNTPSVLPNKNTELKHKR